MRANTVALLLVAAALAVAVLSAPNEVLACEGVMMNLTCPAGTTIEIVRANYGRFHRKICNDDYEPVEICENRDRTEIVMRQRCDNRVDCFPLSDDSTFGTTCPQYRNNHNYLQAEFLCLTAHQRALPTSRRPPTTTTQRPTTTAQPVSSKQGQRREDDEGDLSMSTTVATSTTTRELLCPEKTVRDVVWPRTAAGHDSIQRCPNVPDRDPDVFVAEWSCGPDARWVPTRPNLSRCVAPWARQLRRAADESANEVDALAVAKQLREKTRQETLYGGDVAAVAEALGSCVDAATASLTQLSADYPKPLSELVVNTTNTLLQPRSRDAWADVPPRMAEASATALLNAVERAAHLFVAAPASPDESALAVQTPNIYFEVSTVAVQNEYVLFPNKAFSAVDVDTIAVPRSALIGDASTGVARMAFASYKAIGAYMQPQPVISRQSPNARQSFVQRQVVSQVMSASVVGASGGRSLRRPVILTFVTFPPAGASNPVCAFWDWQRRDERARWSTRGCRLRAHNATHTVCECDHLTHFAVLMDVGGGEGRPLAHDISLTFITYAGCVVSIVCLFLSFVAFTLNRRLIDRERMTIHKNLCFCLLVAELLFVFGMPQVHLKLLCGLVAVALHYAFLAAFSWMLLEGYNVFTMLARPQGKEPNWKYMYLLAYGMPLVIVGASVAVDFGSYGTPRWCWLRADNYFILSFIGPVAVIIVINSCILLFALYIACTRYSTNIRYHPCQHQEIQEKGRVRLKGAAALVFLLGLTWAFGLLYIVQPKLVWAYTFTTLNALQGLFIFLFHVVWNEPLREDCVRFVRNSHCSPCASDYEPARRTRPTAGYKEGALGLPIASHDFRNGILPPIVSHADANGDHGIGKFQYLDTSKPSYNSSALLLVDPCFDDSTTKYDYATVAENGGVVYPTLGRVVPVPCTRLPPPPLGYVPRPPPAFPPPTPPYYTIEPTVDDAALTNSARRDELAAKLSDDSAYSEGCLSMSTSRPAMRSANNGRLSAASDLIARDLSSDELDLARRHSTAAERAYETPIARR